eukprot:7787349-Prorocentrum_lima.AAC.1
MTAAPTPATDAPPAPAVDAPTSAPAAAAPTAEAPTGGPMTATPTPTTDAPTGDAPTGAPTTAASTTEATAPTPANHYYTRAIGMDDLAVSCWGAGEVVDNLPSLGEVSELSAGLNHACAIAVDRNLT